MPLYDFTCSQCGVVFDALIKRDQPNPPCPKCDSEATIKLVSAPAGFEFKGNGFYCTDYKKK